MDFTAILEQREAKAAATTSNGAGGPGRPPSPTSKRAMGWKAATFFLTAETRLRLQQAAGIIQLADPSGDWPRDQSEIIEEALKAWLEQNDERLKQLRFGG